MRTCNLCDMELSSCLCSTMEDLTEGSDSVSDMEELDLADYYDVEEREPTDEELDAMEKEMSDAELEDLAG